jgi:hypothetical protein
MENHFYIKENRLNELKSFIRSFTTTVRFKNNPIKQNGIYHISLTMEVKDGNKLNELFNKWYNEDSLQKEPKNSIWKRLFNFYHKF